MGVGLAGVASGTMSLTKGQLGRGQGVVGHGHDDRVPDVVMVERQRVELTYPSHSYLARHAGARVEQDGQDASPGQVAPELLRIEGSVGPGLVYQAHDQGVDDVGEHRGRSSVRNGIVYES